MKKPKRKQHLIFSALEGIAEVPQAPLASPSARQPLPATSHEMSPPDLPFKEPRPESVSPVPLVPDSPGAHETVAPDPFQDATALDKPLAHELPPPGVLAPGSPEVEGPAPYETPPVSAAPELPRAEISAEEPLPQASLTDPITFGAPTPFQTPSGAPDTVASASTDGVVLASATLSSAQPRAGLLPGLSFFQIPPGVFFMGSPEKESGRGSDEVLHQVTLSKGFSLQATPVTQALWLAVMGTNPSAYLQDGHEQPVENVSWDECQEFIQRLNSIGIGRYRLPTEAEWEYACRASTATAFAGGTLTELQGGVDPVLDVLGWFCGNSGGQPHAVAQKQANTWGLYDMHGNVMEWCRDGYAPYGDIRMHKVQGEWVTTTNERIDPVGLPQAKSKVVRGGSWISTARQCRSAARLAWPADGKADFIGFRLVRE